LLGELRTLNEFFLSVRHCVEYSEQVEARLQEKGKKGGIRGDEKCTKGSKSPDCSPARPKLAGRPTRTPSTAITDRHQPSRTTTGGMDGGTEREEMAAKEKKRQSDHLQHVAAFFSFERGIKGRRAASYSHCLNTFNSLKHDFS
jgi:hypothetical protein